MINSLSRMFHKNPVDLIDLGELRKTEAKLKYQIQTLHNEMDDLKHQIRLIFHEIPSLQDDTMTRSYSGRIISFSELWQVKNDFCNHLERDYRVILNLIAIKEQEKLLKSSGTWKKIQKIDPDALEEWLARSDVRIMDNRQLMDELSEITSCHISRNGNPSFDDSSVNSLIRDIKDGKLSADSAGNLFFRKLSNPKGLEESDYKKEDYGNTW